MDELPLRGVSVLVVEDHTDSREAYAFWLAHTGAAVSTASNAADAHALLRNGFVPSAILTDLHMPEMDGLELLGKIRADFGPGIPLVAITGDVLAANRLVAAGFDACLVKPIDGRAVADEIVRVLALGRGARTE